jgi:hypothetical protein
MKCIKKYFFTLLFALSFCASVYSDKFDITIITEAYKHNEFITVNLTWFVEINEVLISVFQDHKAPLDEALLESIAIYKIEEWSLEPKHRYSSYVARNRKMKYNFQHGDKVLNVFEIRYIMKNRHVNTNFIKEVE